VRSNLEATDEHTEHLCEVAQEEAETELGHKAYRINWQRAEGSPNYTLMVWESAVYSRTTRSAV